MAGLVEVTLTGIASFCVTIALIVPLRPMLLRYALARPNARSSHKIPTPQGGGIAVIVAIAGVSLAVAGMGLAVVPALDIPLLLVAMAMLAVLGALDDVRPLPIWPRLAGQAVCVFFALLALPLGFRALPDFVPTMVEFAILFVGLVGFVNYCNFMDGLDWMTSAELVPVSATLVALFLMQDGFAGEALLASSICGAVAGFAVFNKPIARLFLGDVGSLPLGLLTGMLLIRLAGEGHLAAALLLPLYFLLDAGATMVRRGLRGEAIWQSHRSHFYQIATERGLTVLQVVGRVFIVNLFLAGCAFISVTTAPPLGDVALLSLGLLVVLFLLFDLQRPRSERGLRPPGPTPDAEA